jgi:DNA-binding winged helix-turn-helix (wHTH) protein
MSRTTLSSENGLTSQAKVSFGGDGGFPDRFLRFGTFELDVVQQKLSRDGSRIRLEGNAYEVLMVLLENSDAIVTREMLRMRLWPHGGPVNYDSNVSTTVSKLCRVLGDTDEPTFIETIPLRGYSFIAKVEYRDQPTVGTARRNAPERDWKTWFLRRPSDAKPSGSNPRSIWFTAGVVALFIAAVLLGATITLYSRSQFGLK